MSSIFVFGLFSDSSGKTVVSAAVARGLMNDGINVSVFKPRSGHSMWYQYDACLTGKAEGRLFCEDIIKLKEASRCALPYEVLNPVDALMSPLNVEAFLRRRKIPQMYLLEPEVYSHLIVERYTNIKDGKIENLLLVNEGKVNTGLVLLDKDYLIRLRNLADKTFSVHSFNEWSSFFKSLEPSSVSSCYQLVRHTYDPLIVEGFNDAVSPEPRILYDIDVVIGVAPRVAVFYDAKDYKRVIKAMAKLGKDPRL